MVYGPAPPSGSTVVGGVTKVTRKFVGPVRPGTDVEKFRRTGISRPTSDGRIAGPTRADLEAEQKRKASAEAAVKKASEVAARTAAETAARLAAQRTQIALRGVDRVVGPTRKTFERQQRLRREPEVQPIDRTFISRVKDLPSKAIEKVTGRKPREVFRFITGSQEKDITKPVTLEEAVVETTQVPIRALSITAAAIGAGAKKAAKKVIPEGVTVTIKAKEAKEVSFIEPQFGTISTEAPEGVIERTITIPARGERTVKIFEPERIGEGVKMGTEFAAIGTAPLLFAPGFMASGAQTVLDVEKSPVERVLGGVEAALGGLIIGAKGARYLRGGIKTVTPTRSIRKTEAFEVQKVIPIKEKPTTVSVFEIRGEISPPTIVEETTRGRQIIDLFGKQAEKIVQVGRKPVVSIRAPPKVTKIPAKEFIIRTPEPVIGEQPFVVSEIVTGRKFATISRVEGTTKKISLEEFSKLSKQEQFLLQKRAIEVVGREVPLSQVPIILSRETERATSLIRSQKLLRVTPRPRVSDVKMVPGKRRPVLSLAVSEAAPAVEIEAGELIKARTLFRDVTFERQILKGKPSPLDTTILRLKPKPKDTVMAIKPADIKKTPLSETFQTQEVEFAAAKAKLPKQEPVKPSRIVLEAPVVKTERIIPSIVGGDGIRAESVFAGTGQFEVTTPQVIGRMRPSITEKQEPSVEVKQLELQIQPRVQKGKVKQVTKQIKLLKSLEKQKQVEKVNQLEAQKSIVIQKSLQAQKQVEQLSGIQARPAPQIQARPKPMVPIKILPTTTPAKRAVKELAKAVKKDFEVFARVEGQDVSIGKATTKKQAKILLSKKLKKTLSASGFIEEDGKRLSAKETGLINGEFRVGRLDVTRVVQKKTARLGTKTETEQIQFFRASKGGGNLFGSSNRGRKKSDFF